MAYSSVWYLTDLPKSIIEIIEQDLKENFDSQMKNSLVFEDILNTKKRNSQNAWIPTSHWLGGFLWHYIQRANRENFLYDLHSIDGETIQYTKYKKGMFYDWHTDEGLSTHYKPISNYKKSCENFVNENAELVRKLSFSLQLSNPDDYEGGNLQILNENDDKSIAPREQGTMVLFDSRTEHRVLPVKKGVRKSIVGWVVGPRWK